MSKRHQQKGPGLPAIVCAGHPVLRQEAQPMSLEQIRQPETQILISTMVAVMRAAPGVGLAAPQIGLCMQIIVYEDLQSTIDSLPKAESLARERSAVPLTVIINPRLTLVNPQTTVRFREGCLSVPGYSADVERALEVRVEGLDARGEPIVREARGWPARILQHECDHLAGTLYIDRMHSRSFVAETPLRASAARG